MLKKLINESKNKNLKLDRTATEELNSIKRCLLRYDLEKLSYYSDFSKQQLLDISRGDIIPNSAEKERLKRAIGLIADDTKHQRKRQRL